MKGIHLEGLRVLGKPQYFANLYYEQGADELIYMDVVASLYQRNSLLDIVRETARNIFIPLTVGGGLRTISDIRDALRSGADKVSVNTAAVRDPELVRRAVEEFGSSTIVVSIEAIRRPDSSYEAYTDNGRESTGLDVFEWAERIEALGAGEILLTSIDREGTGRGYDLPLIRRVADSVSIPVIACGGAGSPEDVYEAVVGGHADAVSLASLVHYDAVSGAALDESVGSDPQAEGNFEYLKSGRSSSRISPATLPEIKQYLSGRGVPCRPAQEFHS